MKKERIPDLLSEIKDELSSLEIVVSDIRTTAMSLPSEPRERKIYMESLALKIHNFYTGCERIFQKIAGDINGGVPASGEWHRRLLKIMTLEIEGVRPPVIGRSTESTLQEFLAFRHVIRNIYGFELNEERILALAAKTEDAYLLLSKDTSEFLDFLRKMNI